MEKRKNYKKINHECVIMYDNSTNKYGRAEFDFCPVFKNGFMKEMYIFRRQQIDNSKYVLSIPKGLKIDVFNVESWLHKTESPRIWRNFWCKEHNTIAFEVYVPKDTNMIVFEFHFGNTLTIRFE